MTPVFSTLFFEETVQRVFKKCNIALCHLNIPLLLIVSMRISLAIINGFSQLKVKSVGVGHSFTDKTGKPFCIKL